jgi:hypothetical protein
MKHYDAAFYHKLYGLKKPRAVYYKKDFLDYSLMVALSAIALRVCFGAAHVLSFAGYILCGFAVATFVVRHGVEFRLPLILSSPQEIYSIFLYKAQNLRPVYFIALGVFLVENLLIGATPGLPHHVEWMRKTALWLFYVHFISITIYRTVSLIDHLAKKDLVREVLMQTPWQRAVKEKTNMTLEILHAYSTGVLTHIVLIGPWYFIILHAKFSLVFLPVVAIINVAVHMKWLRTTNDWFYRDHWLGHNNEFEFVFLHGTHHDAIPSGLIAVAENGFLEGLMRSTMGFPVPFYDPLVAFAVYTSDIKVDIDTHQYIPGVFPRLPRQTLTIAQHATHHYGPIEPYSLAVKLDQPGLPADIKKGYRWLPNELMNSIQMDEELTGFKWDNPTYRRILSLYDKYHRQHESNQRRIISRP